MAKRTAGRVVVKKVTTWVAVDQRSGKITYVFPHERNREDCGFVAGERLVRATVSVVVKVPR